MNSTAIVMNSENVSLNSKICLSLNAWKRKKKKKKKEKMWTQDSANAESKHTLSDLSEN